MSLKEKIHNAVYLGRYKSRNANPTCCSKVKRCLSIVLVLGLVLVLTSTQVKGVLNLLHAPKLPELQTLDSSGKPLPQHWLQQNWGGSAEKVSADTHRYHHISQGTGTLPMPYDWFMALEKPDDSLVYTLLKSLFFVESDLFSGNDYLLRYGFIRGEADPILNPDGLPIGFTKTESLNLPGLNVKADGIGFNCSACHTGHFVSDGKEYVIEGGPATTDLGQLTAGITASLGQTGLASKLPFFDGRFDRFAKRVLGTQYNPTNKALLSNDLADLIQAQQELADIIKVQEGYTRLDALNRIGNQVFSKDIGRKENYQPIDAPVNYPFIWTSSWFKWVQYDGSIMEPLVRNVGESMGVSAFVNMGAPQSEGQFQSSVPIENMVWIEHFLKGKAFNEGLTAPAWPFERVSEGDSSYQLGKDLYEQRCQGCHLPVLGNPALDKHFAPIAYLENGKKKYTKEEVLDVIIVDHDEIGTDPAQGNVLVTRLLDTAGNDEGIASEETKGLGLDGVVCGQNPNQVYDNLLFEGDSKVDLVDGITIKDGGDVSFAFALGAIVDQTINAWFDANFVSDAELKDNMRGGRPNCLQAGQGYKARPLNGVWATAPFLHNGSVPTIRDLICKSEDERPDYLLLGDIHFDKENVGLVQPNDFAKQAKKYTSKGELYTNEGYFILDTSIPGNGNHGHNFSDEYDPSKEYYNQKTGVIGPKFNEQECNAILDYIKTI